MSDGPDWNQIDWNDLYPRLMLVAARRLRRSQWRVLRSEQDFVHDAIRKTISGVRRWDFEKYELYVHLCGVIYSEISNAVTSMDNRSMEHIDNIVDFPLTSEHSPERIIIEKDLLEKFLDFLKNRDPDLLVYFNSTFFSEAIDTARQKTLQEKEGLRKRLRKAANAFLKLSGKPSRRESDGGASSE
jgi:hypothetical protein